MNSTNTTHSFRLFGCTFIHSLSCWVAIYFEFYKNGFACLLICKSFLHATSNTAIPGCANYSHRNFKLKETYGRLPDSTAYVTVIGSKRLTKSSLAQMRNPDLVINLKKDKANNKNPDARVV